MRVILFLVLYSISIFNLESQNSIALLKYSGGGDWYSNPTSLPNLVRFCNAQLKTDLNVEIPTVEPGSIEMYNYPMIHVTGHGNIVFSSLEAENLKIYLLGGGFIHADDNYGLKPFFFKAMKQVFPDKEWKKIPFSHPVFHQKYDFNSGLPKIHSHDGKSPLAWGLFEKGRMICLFTEECDLGDGWEDPSVHGDTQEAHTKALMMGANIINFVFTQ